MARTRKQCPGCGQVDPKRKADAVCQECRQKLEGFDMLTDAVEKQDERVVRVFHIDNLMGWIPSSGAWETRRALMDALTALVDGICKPVPDGICEPVPDGPTKSNRKWLVPIRPRTDATFTYYGRPVLAPAGFISPFADLIARMGEMVKDTYEKGVRDGERNTIREVTNVAESAQKWLSFIKTHGREVGPTAAESARALVRSAPPATRATTTTSTRAGETG